jgi:hypothetical protein
MENKAATDGSESRGASAGDEAAAVGTRKTAGLRRLCDELGRRQAEIDRLSRDGAPSDAMDAVLDDWWATVEAITARPGRTLKAMRSKARAVRIVMAAVGKDRCPEATALVASLLADLLREEVELP